MTGRPVPPPPRLNAYQLRIAAAGRLGLMPRPQTSPQPRPPRTAAEALYPNLANQNRKDAQ